MNEQILDAETTEVTPVIRQQQLQPYQNSDPMEIMERRNALFDKMVPVAIKATVNDDWQDEAGKPFLRASGTQKIARRFGVKIYDTQEQCEEFNDQHGKYYLYTYKGKAALPGGIDVVEAIGTCSSRDKFFGRANGGYKPNQDVDRANIKKKAFTNFLGRVVKELIGLNGLSWNDLAKHNISKDGKTTVQYKQKPGTQQSAPQQSPPQAKQQPEQSGNSPLWKSEYNGKEYVFARVCKSLDEEFLKSLGMKESEKKPGLFSRLYDERVFETLCNAVQDED